MELHRIIPQLGNHLGHTGSAHRNALRRHAQSFLRSNVIDGLQDILVIQKRLSHAHVNNIGQWNLVPFLGFHFQIIHLIKNLTGSEIAHHL